MPATARGKKSIIHSSWVIYSICLVTKGFGPDQETIETTVFRKRADWPVISQFLQSEKWGKPLSVVSTTPQSSHAVFARGNSMSAFHLPLCLTQLSISQRQSLPFGFFSLKSQKTHTHSHKQTEKKHILKVCEMKPDHHSILPSSKREEFGLHACLRLVI